MDFQAASTLLVFKNEVAPKVDAMDEEIVELQIECKEEENDECTAIILRKDAWRQKFVFDQLTTCSTCKENVMGGNGRVRGNIWKVDRLLGVKRDKDGNENFLVRWHGYCSCQDSWVHSKNLFNLQREMKVIREKSGIFDSCMKSKRKNKEISCRDSKIVPESFYLRNKKRLKF